MAEIANAIFQAGQFAGEAPATGILAAIAGDGTVKVLEAWDPVQGDATHHAPAGSAGGGGTRRHLFDREVYVDSDGVGTYVNVRAFASITGKPTTLAGYGITNAVRNDASGTLTGVLTVSAPAASYGTVQITAPAGFGTKLLFGEATGGYGAGIMYNVNVGTFLEFYAGGVGAGNNVGTWTASTLTIKGAIATGTDAANDIGSGSFRFRAGFFSGAITAGTVTTSGSITLGNGQYLKGTRNTGGLILNLLGYDAGTDDISMTNSGNFIIKDGGGTARLTLVSTGALTLTASLAGITTLSGSGAVSGFTTAVFSSTVTSKGVVISTGGSSNAGSLWMSAIAGLILDTQTGSSADFKLVQPGNSGDILSVATGTKNVTLGGSLTLTGSILPASDAALDLGSGSFRWRGINASGGTITLTPTAFTVGSASAVDANALTLQANTGNYWVRFKNAAGTVMGGLYTTGTELRGDLALTILSGVHNVFSVSGSSEFVAIFTQSHATQPYGLEVSYSAAAPNGTANEFLYCVDNAAVRATIRSNGGLANFSANNVNLSDERLKTGLVDLESQWDNHKRIRVVRGRFIDQTHDDDNYMGTAQNIEAIYPELVDDFVVREATDDAEEETAKAIYETDLNWITRGVVQECQTRIERLEQFRDRAVAKYPDLAAA